MTDLNRNTEARTVADVMAHVAAAEEIRFAEANNLVAAKQVADTMEAGEAVAAVADAQLADVLDADAAEKVAGAEAQALTFSEVVSTAIATRELKGAFPFTDLINLTYTAFAGKQFQDTSNGVLEAIRSVFAMVLTAVAAITVLPVVWAADKIAHNIADRRDANIAMGAVITAEEAAKEAATDACETAAQSIGVRQTGSFAAEQAAQVAITNQIARDLEQAAADKQDSQESACARLAGVVNRHAEGQGFNALRANVVEQRQTEEARRNALGSVLELVSEKADAAAKTSVHRALSAFARNAVVEGRRAAEAEQRAAEQESEPVTAPAAAVIEELRARLQEREARGLASDLTAAYRQTDTADASEPAFAPVVPR